MTGWVLTIFGFILGGFIGLFWSLWRGELKNRKKWEKLFYCMEDSYKRHYEETPRVCFFNRDYSAIPMDELPACGNIIICHESQKRLNSVDEKTTWEVGVSINDGYTPSKTIKARGLFWELEDAKVFARALKRDWMEKHK